MFESLDAESARELKRWQAPRLDARVASIVDRRPVARDEAVATDKAAATEAGSAAVTTVSVEQAARASAELEQQLQQRYDAGREAGLLEGALVARRDANERSAVLLNALTRERDCHEHELEDEVLALSQAMARLILRRELAHDAALLHDVVREALERMPLLAETPVVHLHPADADAMTPLLVADKPVRIVADESLDRGDCRIEAGASLVDAGIDAWVASLASSEAWRQATPAATAVAS